MSSVSSSSPANDDLNNVSEIGRFPLEAPFFLTQKPECVIIGVRYSFFPQQAKGEKHDFGSQSDRPRQSG